MWWGNENEMQDSYNRKKYENKESLSLDSEL